MARGRPSRARILLALAAGALSLPLHALELDRQMHSDRLDGPQMAHAIAAPGVQLTLARELRDRARPAPPAAVPFDQPTDAIVVALRLNQVKLDESFVRMTRAGEYLVKWEDLAAMMSDGSKVPAVAIDGEPYVRFSAIPGAKAVLNEKTLTLEVTLPPAFFRRQVYDLTPPVAAPVLAARSAMLNYRAGYAGVSGAGGGTLSLSAELAVAWNGWLLRNLSYHAAGDGHATNARLETQALLDDRDNLRRLVLGDAVTPGRALGSSLPLTGITFAKAYDMAPSLVRQPSVGFHGMADLPSQVDFYVGSTLVTRQRVAPGPFDIQNFAYYGGRRDVRVVIRDALGREQTVAYPFYFAPAGLAAGLHDYSYQAGWTRENAGQPDAGYGPFVASAFHQYGFTDHWTAGFRAEATTRAANAGPAVVYRSERFGVFALNTSVSRDRATGRNGDAWSFSHAFQQNEFSSQVQWQRFSPEYALALALPGARLPRADFSASVGYSSPRLGAFTVGFTRLALPDEPLDRSVLASYSRSLARGLTFNATLRRRLSEPSGSEFFLGVQYTPTPDRTVNVAATRDLEGMSTTSVSFGNQTPPGEGLTYSAALDRQAGHGIESRSFRPRVEWFTRYAAVSAEAGYLTGTSIGPTTAYAVALSGSVVAAGGLVSASRSITDSFAIVQLEPPLEGVRVYENNQQIGRTDAKGRILLPNITSYASNSASIQDKDVPIDRSVDRIGQTFSPAARSGTVITFQVTPVRALTATLVFRDNGRKRALAHRVVSVRLGDRALELFTGEAGELYAENIPQGRHRARTEVLDRPCDFVLDVPAVNESTSLGEVMTCDASH